MDKAFDGLKWAYKEGASLYIFQQMNTNGIAVLMFVHSTRKRIQNEAFVEPRRHNVIHLTPDRGALREFGAGFNINRRKFNEKDPVPTEFQFWYKVVNEILDFGWKCRGQVTATQAKQLAMAERWMKVKKCWSKAWNRKKYRLTSK